MYSYYNDEFIPLTMENILLRVSEEDIFSMVEDGKYKPDLEKQYHSPFRKDENPACIFSYYNNKLCFTDWADPQINRDCISFIRDFYNLSFKDALSLINSHFNLNLGVSKEIETITPTKKINSYNKTKKDTREIYYKVRNFYDADRIFWERFKITKTNLDEDLVCPVLWYKFFSKKHNDWIAIRPNDICYAYTDFDNNKVKIYRPYGPKEGKWLTNCTTNDLGGINLLPLNGKRLVFSKSYKDYRVLKNYGIDNIWVQSESQFPNERNIIMLGKRFDEFVVFFDNDKVGKTNAEKFMHHLNSIFPDKAHCVFIENEKTKDPSDLIEYSQMEFEKFLIKNKLICKK